MKYGYRKGRFTKSNASRLGKLGAEAKAHQRLASPPGDSPRRVPPNGFLGTISWHAADGTKRQWIVRQGTRMNGIRVLAKGKVVECGWDWFLAGLRKHLAMPKRLFLDQLSHTD